MDKIVPHDIGAEEAVIGSLLLEGDIKSANLKQTDFLSDACAMAYAACHELSEKGVAINQITVAQKLSGMGCLEKCGGAAYLSHLISIVPTSLDLPYYADIVRRLSTYRQLLQASKKIEDIAYQAKDNVNESLARADELLVSLRKKSGTLEVVSPDDRMKILAGRYEKLYTSEGGMALKSGLIGLDRELGGGFYSGDLVIVGARSGMGKTTFLQCVANNMSEKYKVLFCSGEMSVESLSDRDVAGLLGKRVNEVRLGGFDADTYVNITGQILETLQERQVYYFDKTLTMPSITQAAVSMKARVGLDVLVVDYLGLLADEAGENQNIRLGSISRKLKGLARELDIPAIVAHQLSRAPELRSGDDKRPQLQDLRESGHIEEDADVVLMLYHEDYYNQESNEPTEIIIRKHRQGRANVRVRVYFDEKHQTYKDLTRQEVQAGF